MIFLCWEASPRGGQDLLANSPLSNRQLTPETTKPPHFCGGFVLYGAAPRVESNLKILIIVKFPKIKISSIPKATLYPLKLML